MISASRALLLSMLLPMLGVLPAIPAVCADKAAAAVKPGQPRTVLVFSLTRGFRHESIAATTRALKEIGAESGAFTVTESEDPAVFEPESLRKYDAVVMNNPDSTCSSRPTWASSTPPPRRPPSRGPTACGRPSPTS